MKHDLFFALSWWFYILLLGIIFLPLTRHFFSRFFDKGYLFSKIIGILVASYSVWLFSSFRLFPFSRETIGCLLLTFIFFIFVRNKGYNQFKVLLKDYKRVFIAEECLFLVGFLFWSYIRGLQPDIFGLEKFTDFGFVSSLLRTSYMPPIDQWYAGESINYYYYGQYICAFLIKLSGIPPEIAYNLMIATLFSFTLSLTFSLTANFIYTLGNRQAREVIWGGLVSALLIAFGSSLHTVIYAYILPWAYKMGFYDIPVKSYWYPDATRYIGFNPSTNDKTIHEFPHYSFVVSDLHAHVSDIPVVISILAIAFLWLIQPVENRKITLFSCTRWTVMTAFLLSITMMTNSWDFPIYFLMVGFVLLHRNLRSAVSHWRKGLNMVIQSVQIFALSALFALPFALHFENIAKGVGLVHAHTPLYQLLVLWGYQLMFVGGFVLALYFLGKQFFQNTPEKNKPFATLRGFMATLSLSDKYVLMLSFTAILFLIVPEIIYVKDIYGEDHHRANTMFKFTYQSFMIFCIAIGYIFVMAKNYIKTAAPLYYKPYAVVFMVLFLLPLLYPYWAIRGYYGPINMMRYKGLDGTAFLQKLYPDDYEALLWLNRNLTGQPVVLEANGDSFTIANRISSLSGFPTILGWYVHEWLYRGDPSFPNARVPEISTVYESPDDNATQEVLHKYNVKYIVIGKLERDKFKKLDTNKLFSLGKVVFQSPQTQIIQVD